jgi:hypothetical protein
MHPPRSLLSWIIAFEVWRDGQPYRDCTLNIPAETEAEARLAVEQIARDLFPNLWPTDDIVFTTALNGPTHPKQASQP